MRAITFPFSLDASGHIKETASYEEVVRAQVIDALMTNQGERVFRARYGCDTQAALFDPSDELVRRDAGAVLKTRLERLVNRCIVRSCIIELGAPGTVNITIVYRPSLYASDTSVTVPTSSEFLSRQSILGGVDVE
jgi:phage baseplate assembly protein W